MRSKIIFFLFTFFFLINSLTATSGKLKTDSIVECDGILYGYHGSDKHYHIAIKNGNSFDASGESLGTTLTCGNEIIKAKNEIKEVILDKCIDGDTASFLIDGRPQKVRFLAIDTPETVHPTKDEEKYGKNASEYTCFSLKSAKQITLEFDSGSDLLDKYDRVLAWVFVDDELLQKTLVRIGYAEVKYIYGSYRYTDMLYEEQELAKKEQLGIWNDYEVVNTTTKVGIGTIFLIIIYLLIKNSKKIKRVVKKLK